MVVYRARQFSRYAVSGRARVQQEKGGHFLIGFQPTNQILLLKSGHLLIIHEVSQLAVCGELQHWRTLHRFEFDLADAITISTVYKLLNLSGQTYFCHEYWAWSSVNFASAVTCARPFFSPHSHPAHFWCSEKRVQLDRLT